MPNLPFQGFIKIEMKKNRLWGKWGRIKGNLYDLTLMWVICALMWLLSGHLLQKPALWKHKTTSKLRKSPSQSQTSRPPHSPVAAPHNYQNHTVKKVDNGLF